MIISCFISSSKIVKATSAYCCRRLQNIEEEKSDEELDDSLDINAEISIEDDHDKCNKTAVPMISQNDALDAQKSYPETDDEGREPINAMHYSTAHGIMWLPIDCQITTRRFFSHNIIREISGPNILAQRSIIGGVIRRAWDLLIDKSILRQIQRCKEEGARRVLQNDDWSLSLN